MLTGQSSIALEPSAARFLTDNSIELRSQLVVRTRLNLPCVRETWAMILERTHEVGFPDHLMWLHLEVREGGAFRWDEAVYDFARCARLGTLSYDEYVAREAGRSPDVVLTLDYHEKWTECVHRFHAVRRFFNWDQALLARFFEMARPLRAPEIGPAEESSGGSPPDETS
ncbi:hypothetical protein [Amycolatopsis dendrobii]|uniref:Uncharacterized protein n=1 Tax=Amycolatopsis dendrobii TaxID=2760662 RepID=A0A7W3VUS0_9PSEU|nr:hypothetical protein [Amycolatopsis dendrobii]MBB1153535.1 hypothetical protein [Amycolatopsis dendrobii]